MRNKSSQRKPNKTCFVFDDRKWYKFFRKNDIGQSIEGTYTSRQIYDGVVISLDDTDEGRLYTLFKSYIDLFEYMKFLGGFGDTYNTLPAFFEVILGDKPQKPHFDVEIKLDEFSTDYPDLVDKFEDVGDQVLKHLIQGIIKILGYKGVELNLSKDLLIYSSHGSSKRSFHVVVNNYCHIDNEEAKAFYELVKNEVKYFSEYIDMAVYSKLQQFRLLGCEKPGSNRPKVFWETFTFDNTNYTHIYSDPSIDTKLAMLQESLVSFTSLCQLLPNFSIREKKVYDSVEITVEQAEAALNFLSDSHCYKIIGINNVVSLKRLKPSYCRICERTHQSENPYLTIFKGNVYFHCRRSTGRMLIGKLSGELMDEQLIELGFQKYIEENLPPSDINLDEFEDMNPDKVSDIFNKDINNNIVKNEIENRVELAKSLASCPLPKMKKKRTKKKLSE